MEKLGKEKREKHDQKMVASKQIVDWPTSSRGRKVLLEMEKKNVLQGFYEKPKDISVGLLARKKLSFAKLAGNFCVLRVFECRNPHFTSLPTTIHSASMSFSL